MIALDASEEGRQLRLQRGVVALQVIEEMVQEYVLGRDRGVGLQLEQPLAVGFLARLQVVARLFDERVQRAQPSDLGLDVTDLRIHGCYEPAPCRLRLLIRGPLGPPSRSESKRFSS